jgi:homoserine O-acetyltransferase
MPLPNRDSRRTTILDKIDLPKTMGGKRMSIRALIAAMLLAAAVPVLAQETAKTAQWPAYQEADYTVSNYKFSGGETMPDVKLHYRTIGTPKSGTAPTY